MGRRIKTQRAGKGSPKHRATHRAKHKIKYVSYNEKQKKEKISGEITRILSDKGKTGVLAEILFEDNSQEVVYAAEGAITGQTIEYGKKAGISLGNVLPLRELPEGCPIFNVELEPGDGGKFIRAAGSYALILTKDAKNVYLKMPSGKKISFLPECRATIGCVAGGGRKEKPFVKAGNAYHLMKSKRKQYPTVRGVAMNPDSHPFGGAQHHPGKSKSTSRHAPPGRKIGAIASSRTGRKKK
ncbi:50S ribosomal protein L2, partial [Candidatus Micrarchaeota archaeon]|nr:50S ribosomal protein L2 [Candidatus Micrarchaeota archaeon]MBU2476671.1 50S ribosomal protein L2 [Candidatus Micrarchaeota archaeon]